MSIAPRLLPIEPGFLTSLWLCLVLLPALSGCGRDDAGADSVRAPLAQHLQNPEDAHDRAIAAFYAGRDHRPFWTRARGEGNGFASRHAEALIAQLRAADDKGLPSERYTPDAVAGQLALRLDAASRAQAEVAVSRVFLRFAAEVSQGRMDPAKTDDAWLIPRRSFDPDRALALLEEDGVDRAIEALEPQREEYRRLLAARRVLVERIAAGGWRPVRYEGSIEPGELHAALPQIRARLSASGELEGDDAPEEPQRYDEATVAAVKDFQRRHGLEVDGILGPDMLELLNVSAEQRLAQIDHNLERLRWLPDPPRTRHVAVNLAGFRLQAFDGEERVLQMPVIVGKEQTATPAFADEIEYLELNPYWNVPNSIVVGEIAPKLLENPRHLQEQNMEVVRKPGPDAEPLDPARIDWSRYADPEAEFPYLLRQRPGPKNALGRIKFIFPNAHAIYLHDTPAGHLFAEAQRAFSHGCIRVRNPLALADYLLEDTPDWDGRRVREAIEAGERGRVLLAEKVPVYLYYLTAWVDGEDGRVSFREDIYGRDRKLGQQLTARRSG